ncbi:RNA polymerase sigma factor [Paludisphaera soli]|uniref:RNA polymerase sigma factor n=1 Tax=Paludisphaera soli TaxID=2712865 RepID=UPI0013E9CA87|nr:sigma-70 family RNA polymerase sigma factor [Paludisphaera soli]
MNPSNRAPALALQTLMTLGVLGDWSDGRLLELYRSRRPGGDEAFQVLVRRHGPMVLAVCRAVAGPGEADDAFQAVFLVLIRRAGSIRKEDSLGPWLHGVAVRVARKARRRRSRDAARVRPVDAGTLASIPARRPDAGGSAEIDAEIERLPERERLPLVLCTLEGLSYDQAARTLGVSESTLRGRLHRARRRLEARLRSRDVSVPSTLAIPVLPRELLDAVLAIGKAATPIPTTASSFAKGAIFAMAFSPSKCVAGLTLATLLTTLGVLGSEVVVGLWSPPPLEFRWTGAGTGSSSAPPREFAAAGAADEPFPPLSPPEPIRPPGSTPAEIEARNRAIRAALEAPVDFDFPEGVALDRFLEHLKEATAKGDDPGIPVHVEPTALDGDLSAYVTKFVSRGRPARVALRTYLGSLGLGFAVHDGFLRVDSQAAAAEYRSESIEARLDRLIELLEAREDAAPH